jgi:hypothetical protein
MLVWIQDIFIEQNTGSIPPSSKNHTPQRSFWCLFTAMSVYLFMYLIQHSLKVVTNEKGEAVGAVLTIIC